MKALARLRRSNPVGFALTLIAAFVLLTFAGDAVSALVDTENSATALALLAMSAVLIAYLGRNQLLEYYGLRPLRRTDFTRALFYLPLIAIVLLQFIKGIDTDLAATTIVWIVLLMLAVGFLEELIFRGVLFKAILETSTLTRAIVISGVTFGLGHVVNLARGMSLTGQVMQVLLGIVLGIVLALIFAVTGTIVPLVVFHALLNISANITHTDATLEPVIVAVTLAISAAYAAPLVQTLRRRQQES